MTSYHATSGGDYSPIVVDSPGATVNIGTQEASAWERETELLERELPFSLREVPHGKFYPGYAAPYELIGLREHIPLGTMLKMMKLWALTRLTADAQARVWQDHPGARMYAADGRAYVREIDYDAVCSWEDYSPGRWTGTSEGYREQGDRLVSAMQGTKANQGMVPAAETAFLVRIYPVFRHICLVARWATPLEDYQHLLDTIRTREGQL